MRHLFLSQRMVNSQEIDFHHFHVPAANLELLGHTYDTREDFLVFAVSNQEVELLDVAWTCDTPSELGERVVESEMSNLVFDVVLHQKFDNFLTLLVISHIEIAPLEASG